MRESASSLLIWLTDCRFPKTISTATLKCELTMRIKQTQIDRSLRRCKMMSGRKMKPTNQSIRKLAGKIYSRLEAKILDCPSNLLEFVMKSLLLLRHPSRQIRAVYR